MTDVERTGMAATEGMSSGNVAPLLGSTTLKTTRAIPIARPMGQAIVSKEELAKVFTLADVDPIGRTEVLLYGPPKVGKTVAWSTFPPPFRVIDADNGLRSVRWAFTKGKTSFKSMDQLVGYRPTEELDKPYPEHAVAFDKVCDMVDYWFSPGEVEKWEGGTLVIDSFTEMNEWAILKGLELNNKLPEPKKPLSGSHKINLKAEARLITGQQDYKSAMAFLDTFLAPTRVNCALHNRNLVVVCHEYTEDSEDSDGNRIIVRYRPLLIGQLRERLPKSFDDLWYMIMYHGPAGPEPKIRVHGSPKILAGSRWGDVLNTEEEPDYRKMIEKVKQFHGIR